MQHLTISAYFVALNIVLFSDAHSENGVHELKLSERHEMGCFFSIFSSCTTLQALYNIASLWSSTVQNALKRKKKRLLNFVLPSLSALALEMTLILNPPMHSTETS